MPSKYCCSPDKAAEKSYKLISSSLSKLASQGTSLCYKKGQILFYEGHLPFGFYNLKKGVVSLFYTCAHGPSRTKPQRDKLLGLVHLLSNTTNCSTCRAEGDVEVIYFPKQTVFELLNKTAKP